MKRFVTQALLILAAAGVCFSAVPASQPASYPADWEGARVEVYKTVGKTKLRLYIFEPEKRERTDKRPAIVFFHGGGWRKGTPRQFTAQCLYLASRGMVAITVEYRLIAPDNDNTMADCVRDAFSAIRWVRTNAGRLGIDPGRIAAAGGSAGGHLAAATGTLSGFDTAGENPGVSARPDLMALFNPAVDLTPKGFRSDPDSPRYKSLFSRLGADIEKLSPIGHIDARTPPTIIFHGTADKVVPFSQIRDFAATMRKSERPCELVAYRGEGHGFFNYRGDKNPFFAKTMARLDEFLLREGFLEGEPTIDRFMKHPRP